MGTLYYRPTEGEDATVAGGIGSSPSDIAKMTALVTKAQAVNDSLKEQLDALNKLDMENFTDVVNHLENYEYTGTRFLSYDVVHPTNMPNHDFTFVGDDIWAFNKPSDGGAAVIDTTTWVSTMYTLTLYETLKDGSSKELQMKSVDYSAENSALMVGNGRSGYSEDDSYIYIFYNSDTWPTLGSPITFDNCGDYTKIDITDLGYKTYAYWGDDPSHNEIFVSCNLFQKIYRLRLGRGTNQLSKGTYTAPSNNNYFNGTYEIIKMWVLGGSYLGGYADHGGQFYKGNLYLTNNMGTPSRIFKVVFLPNGYFKFEIMQFDHYDDQGNELWWNFDGMAIKDGIIYLHPLSSSVSKDWKNLLRIRL